MIARHMIPWRRMQLLPFQYYLGTCEQKKPAPLSSVNQVPPVSLHLLLHVFVNDGLFFTCYLFLQCPAPEQVSSRINNMLRKHFR